MNWQKLRGVAFVSLALVVMLAFVPSAYAFDPVTHGYIGEQTAGVVKIEDVPPNLWIFENGSIYADVMHLDDTEMHGNKAFTGEMMDRAENLDQLTWAAAFRAHQIADDVWVKWTDDHGVPRGGPYVPIEAGYEFLFAAYALTYKGYALPVTFPFYPGLIQGVYKARTGHDLSSESLWLIKNSIWAAAIGEVVLAATLQPTLIAYFELPVGPAATVRKSFVQTVEDAKHQSVMSIESRWYEFKAVGTFRVEHKSGIRGKRWTDTSKWPRLTDGWERSHWKIIEEYHERYLGRDWSGSSVNWATGDKYDPNVTVKTWADGGKNYVKVVPQVWAKRKKGPEEVTVSRLELPQPLMEAIAAKRATMLRICLIEPLLTKPGVTVEELEARQQELMGLIGKAVQDAGKAIQEGELASFTFGAFTWKDEFVNLIAGKSMEIECDLSTIAALEKRKAKPVGGSSFR